jgi:2'-5' RNA ligase
MKRFAIDVVILPPDPVMDYAIKWNRELRKIRPANIVLSKEHRLPHISLAMGCLAEDRLEEALTLLQTTTSSFGALDLHIPGIKSAGITDGDTVVSFDIELSSSLAKFHQAMVNSLSPLLTQDATDANLADPPPIEPWCTKWINQYIPNHCFGNFWPHITLGFGTQYRDFPPYSFKASRVAICHLGNHCTCRRVLGEVNV